MDHSDSLAGLVTNDTLFIRVLGATVPAGSITRIHYPRESKDTRFFTCRDIPGTPWVSFFDSRMPLLAETDVRYEGEPILLAAGNDREALHDLTRKVRVEYETNYTIKTFEHPDASDIVKMKHYRRGDSAKALKDASEVLREEYYFSGIAPRICGAVGAWAHYTGGTLQVYVTSGWIFHIRNTLAESLKLDPKNIIVRAIPAGRSSDTLSWYPSVPAAYAALCSYKTGKPALLELKESEKARILPKSIPVRAVFRTGLGKDGRILGREIDLDMDAGAWPTAPDLLLDRTCVSSLGIYGCPNFTVTGRIITTNNPPADISAGAGLTPVIAASETHASRAALAAGKDPLWFRREAVQPPQEHEAGIRQKKHLQRVEELIQIAAVDADFSRKFAAFELNRKKAADGKAGGGPRRGIGIAVSFADGSLPGLAENDVSGAVGLRLDGESSLSILTSTLPEHESTGDIWKQTAGSILGVNPATVILEPADTSVVPDSGPGILSRNMTIIRSLIERAAGSIQRRRFRSPLPISIKRSFKLPRSVTWDTNTLKGQLFHRLSWAVWVVEVIYDPVLLRTTVTNIWGALDCGRVLQPEGARQAVEEEVHATLADLYDRYCPLPYESIPSLSFRFRDAPRQEPTGLSNLARGGITSAFLAAADQASYQSDLGTPVRKEQP